MLKRLLAPTLTTAVVLAFSLAAAAAEGDYQKMTLKLPEGDAAAGREAFIRLMCTSCHAVQGETGLPQPVVQIPVPVLGPRHAQRTPGKLATAIVSPSHEVSDEVLMKTWSELSPMGDFSEAITVRQLVDLVAYVRSLESSGAPPAASP
jgi:hypothetical protein